MARVSGPEFWEDLYARGGDGWELGAPAPPRGDVFALGREMPNAFDGAWEYTCFCAIDPARRAEYVASLAGAIRPGGWLLGCFFPLRGNPIGPPFPMSVDGVRRALVPAFRVERAFAPTRSARGRQGREWMLLARRTGA